MKGKQEFGFDWNQCFPDKHLAAHSYFFPLTVENDIYNSILLPIIKKSAHKS